MKTQISQLSSLITKALERGHYCSPGSYIITIEHIHYMNLLFFNVSFD